MKLAVLLVPILLLGCKPDTRSVAYYKAHGKERAARLDDCIAADQLTDDCRNLKQAEFEAHGIAASNGSAEVKAP